MTGDFNGKVMNLSRIPYPHWGIMVGGSIFLLRIPDMTAAVQLLF